VILWDAQTRKPIATRNQDLIQRAWFSPSAAYLVLSGNGSETVQTLLDGRTGALIAELPGEIFGDPMFSAGDAQIATSVGVFETPTGRFLGDAAPLGTGETATAEEIDAQARCVSPYRLDAGRLVPEDPDPSACARAP
jgi:hypothetical protein